jgi:hypothetical protein
MLTNDYTLGRIVHAVTNAATNAISSSIRCITNDNNNDDVNNDTKDEHVYYTDDYIERLSSTWYTK